MAFTLTFGPLAKNHWKQQIFLVSPSDSEGSEEQRLKVGKETDQPDSAFARTYCGQLFLLVVQAKPGCGTGQGSWVGNEFLGPPPDARVVRSLTLGRLHPDCSDSLRASPAMKMIFGSPGRDGFIWRHHRFGDMLSQMALASESGADILLYLGEHEALTRLQEIEALFPAYQQQILDALLTIPVHQDELAHATELLRLIELEQQDFDSAIRWCEARMTAANEAHEVAFRALEEERRGHYKRHYRYENWQSYSRKKQAPVG